MPQWPCEGVSEVRDRKCVTTKFKKLCIRHCDKLEETGRAVFFFGSILNLVIHVVASPRAGKVNKCMKRSKRTTKGFQRNAVAARERPKQEVGLAIDTTRRTVHNESIIIVNKFMLFCSLC